MSVATGSGRIIRQSRAGIERFNGGTIQKVTRRRRGRQTSATEDSSHPRYGDGSAFWASRQRNKLLMLAAGARCGRACGLPMSRSGSTPGTDHSTMRLTSKDMSAFIEPARRVAELAGIFVVSRGAAVLNQTSKVIVARRLGDDLLNDGLCPCALSVCRNSGEMGANPDQRLHADAQHLTDAYHGPRYRASASDAPFLSLLECFGCCRDR